MLFLWGVVPSVVFADVDGVSAVSDGDVEVLSIEDGFSDGSGFDFCFCQCSGG